MENERQGSSGGAKLEKEYFSVSDKANGYSEEVTSQLNKLLQGGGVTLGFPIQRRVKTWESLAEKLNRGILTAKSVKDVQDLIGLRVILLFKRDVNKVSDIISQNFKVLKKYDPKHRCSFDWVVVD